MDSSNYLDQWSQSEWDQFNHNMALLFGIEYNQTTYTPPIIENKNSCHGFFKSLEWRDYMTEVMNRTQTKEKISAGSKRLWSNPEYRHKALNHITKLNQKPWIIIAPDGQILKTTNLAKFCRENNLVVNKMRAVAKGKKKIHRGFKCKEDDQSGQLPLTVRPTPV